MKITINKTEINITPIDVENLKLRFRLWQGRRFSYQPKSGAGFKDVSLNHLISAVKNEAFKPEQDINEINDFLKAFKAIQDRGYETSNGQIYKENLLTRLITKIKHFFSKKPRNKLFKELVVAQFKDFDQTTVKGNSKIITSQETKAQDSVNNLVFLKYQQLRESIKNNDVKSAEKILTETPDLKDVVNLIHSSSSITKLGHPIQFIVKYGSVDMLNLLFKVGANLTKCESILLEVGNRESYFDIMQCLIENGAKIKPKNSSNSPLVVVASKWDQNPEKAKQTLRMMIERDAQFFPKDAVEFAGKIPQASLDFLNSHEITF